MSMVLQSKYKTGSVTDKMSMVLQSKYKTGSVTDKAQSFYY